MTHGPAVKVDVETDVLAALGVLAGGSGGPLSQWASDATGLDERVRDRARTLLDGPSGRNLAAALSAIAQATERTSVRVAEAGGGVECAFYTSEEHAAVSILSLGNEGKVRLEDPAPGTELAAFVEMYVGGSRRISAKVSLDLAVHDALVLAALVDAERRKRLGDIAAGRTTASPVSVDDVRAELGSPDRGTFWLLDAVRRQCASDPAAASTSAGDTLARLAQRGLVELTPAAARPSGLVDGLHEQFLVIGTVVELEHLSVDAGGGLKKVGFACLQSGVNDLMTVECLEAGAHIETVSAADLVAYVAHFVGASEPDRPAASTPPPEPSAPRPSFCTTCGTRLGREEKFCTACGTPVAAMATR